MYIHIYICTYTYVIDKGAPRDGLGCRQMGSTPNGAAAEVINSDRLGEKMRPGTFGEIKAGQREHPKKSLCRQTRSLQRP